MDSTTKSSVTSQILLAAWQDSLTHRYYPVGRLTRQTSAQETVFEFCYLKGVQSAQKVGFTVFQAFPDLQQVYRGFELFPLFANRLMPKSRPDFGDYVQRLDLDPSNADEFEILARSAGRRATDSLELFPVPDLDRHGCYVTHFLAHGIGYLQEASLHRIERLVEGEKLLVVADFQNQKDPAALGLRTDDRIFVGYLPRYLLPDAWMLQGECGHIDILVEQVNRAPAPVQHRLLCRMESCWPDNFKPFCTEEYQPISAEAWRLVCPEPREQGL